MAPSTRMRGMAEFMALPRNGAVPDKYGRLLDLKPAPRLPDACLRDIARAMIRADDGAPITEREPADENPAIPAGYTYFGQFVDHDITFDPTPLSAATVDAAARIDFRTPALDLDSLYGRGPADQPYLYDGPFLRSGAPVDPAGARTGSRHDLFRIPAPGQLAGERPQQAVLGDKRNDENKIVAQMHAAVAALHNRIARTPALIRAGGGDPRKPGSVFDTAARLTRWHYQWVVLHDYLERICEPGSVAQCFTAGGKPRLPLYLHNKPRYAYMPVEFAAAAFRFGHSMIRPGYALNRFTGTDPWSNRIPLFTRGPTTENLNGFPATLPDTWGIDWGYFLEGLRPNQPEAGEEGERFAVPQPSYRIDALLVAPLADLPEFRDQPHWVQNLAYRNLARGEGGLPSGEAASKAILGKVSLPKAAIWDAGSRLAREFPPHGEEAAALEETRKARRKVHDKWVAGGGPLNGNTPLWFYVLREAEYYGVTADQNDPAIAFGGQHLGPVGSRIVAETMVGLLAMDPASILNEGKGFAPLPAIAGRGRLTLSRLVAFALGGRNAP